ncbi:MAG TPA: hypothetical protein VM051_10610 [Usitatibacter sp.]|nr:hypothetical protein [Usitatibacter sp.]
MSEMRRMAKMLVERRSESFQSRYARDEAARRFEHATAGFSPKGMSFQTAWREEPGKTWLVVSFAPSRRTRVFLNTASLVLTVMLGASIWSMLARGDAGAEQFLLVLVTVLTVLAFPFVVLGYASQREAEEATLRRKIRRAIVEEEEEKP